MIKKPYKKFITIQDVKEQCGYDLLDGSLQQGGFSSMEESANAFIDEACESIYLLIARNRGVEFANQLFEYYSIEDNQKFKFVALQLAQLYETRFFYDNYRATATIEIDNTKREHSQEAIEVLTLYGIIDVRIG